MVICCCLQSGVTFGGEVAGATTTCGPANILNAHALVISALLISCSVVMIGLGLVGLKAMPSCDSTSILYVSLMMMPLNLPINFRWNIVSILFILFPAKVKIITRPWKLVSIAIRVSGSPSLDSRKVCL